jgi:hypothetical protein
MFGLVNRHRLDDAVRDEFEKQNAALTGFLTVEHSEDGRHTLGEWQTFDVRWLTTSPAALPSIGNGRLTGRYTRIGNTVHLRIDLVIGSTTSVGSGAWLFTLPAPAWPPVLADTPVVIGRARSSLGPGQVMIGVGDAPLFLEDDGGSFFQHNNPGDWAESHKLSLVGTYEAEPIRPR